MANELLSMNKIKKILKLLSDGISKREVSRLVHVSRISVKKYEELFLNHPFSYAELLKLSAIDLDQIVAIPVSEKPAIKSLNAYFPILENELKRTGVTKHLLWEKYLEGNPMGVQYSQFCNQYKHFLKSQKVVYVFDHKLGDKLMIDFAGKKLELIDPQTGEIKAVEFFVGILPASSFTYAQACYSQQSPDFLEAISQCFTFFGGVPKAIVTDNLKPAVTKASKYDPEINQAMADFADHYDTCVLPTRAYSPKDKALVESAVKTLYTRVHAPLNNRIFHSLPELNKAILELVEKHNSMLLQGRDYSRRHTFDTLEKPELKPLPNSAFEIKKYQQATVHPNCHVLLSEDKHQYSVPYQYLGKKVSLNYNNKTVEIYYKYERIAAHDRLKFAHKYSTNVTHLHPKHQYYSNWSVEFFTQQGQEIGENTKLIMHELLTNVKHPEQGFKRCQGVLALAKKYGKGRMEQASELCIYHDLVTLQKLEYILKTDIQMEMLEVVATANNLFHENIRGNNYYQ